MNLKRLSLLLCCAALAGCATTPPMSLTKLEQQNLKGVTGTVFIPQSELLVTVTQTNAGATGLLGALIVAGIDAARRASAAKDAAPMFDQLHDYDFRVVSKQAFNDAVIKVPDVKFNAPLEVDSVASSTEKRIVYDNSSASAVLFVDVRYQLQSGGLYISANAVMYPKASELLQFRKKPNESDPLDAGNAIYRKSFLFGKEHVAAADIKDDLTEGANNIATQLAADLNHPL
ncbi:hypothetical protein BX592_13082 [Paraburkholderia rhizosphaerae]|uniref:Lipoprotein n=2 Tax=Paraburkholderia rhizosphaerae TaxID=480658 RepID=A0A4R8L7X7_9BURK|nr:hypothetical protein BX592_13082 [Paraburkholderia rhizosphaerae]